MVTALFALVIVLENLDYFLESPIKDSISEFGATPLRPGLFLLDLSLAYFHSPQPLPWQALCYRHPEVSQCCLLCERK